MTKEKKVAAKVTVPSILSRKGSTQKIVALTAYDYTFARILDRAGVVDFILVGDSLGSVIQGQDTTLPVTVSDIIYHTCCVTKAVKRALVVADMPFLSYQVSKEAAIANAGRILKETGAPAVKLEGGINMAETIEAITSVDIPVMGHVGLTPQPYHRMGGHRLQGRSNASRLTSSAEKVLEDAMAVESAGAFAVVLEGIPEELAQVITARLSIPTIGIGAGKFCDGQILVTQDLLGMNPDFKPKFLKKYVDLASVITSAVSEYALEVQNVAFPAEENVCHDEALRKQPTLKVAVR